ncbi:uncharacterized protein LTR77_002418 [Saxophila tyrrhenica]|uniref:BZIP domain-containing protein n=1 Tax=Saxophila tyrrhenica TaxID=1690608 RepID=A0AAV9PIG1_9PEZI|nr:hypothetical protein LTR77_002418 [Saxophila tyrrhenica]
MEDKGTAEDDMATDSKVEPPRDGTPSSLESTPEQEDQLEQSQEPAQPVKRKGGRKPIYATSEERKQRNRQAQAAFRERRTEYIKQLEATIKQNEDTLSSLQQSHRSAADECLMLRYKNSLLERILLEKGINVQAELQMKTGSPTLSFQHPAANMPPMPAPQPPLQRTAMQRHHARRSGQNFLPKLAPGQSNQDPNFQNSPQGHPTPSSHSSSPTNVSTRSPMVSQQGGNTPPNTAILAQPQQQHFQTFPRTSQPPPNPAFYQRQQISPNVQRQGAPQPYQSNASAVSSHSTGSRKSLGPSMSSGANPGSVGASSASQYYPSPFQKHIDQLEQEYDTQQSRSMLDQPDPDDNSDPSPDQLHGTYPPQFEQMHPPPTSDFYQAPLNGPPQMQPPQQVPAEGQFGLEMIDPNDAMLDADPFGLSASMHYPTSYSFDKPVQRG